MGRLDLERRIATAVAVGLPSGAVTAAVLGATVDDRWYYAAGAAGIAAGIDWGLRLGQHSHAVWRNFGAFGLLRDAFEDIGPKFRQYFFAKDTEEEPFSRIERSAVYRKAKGVDSTEAFGSQVPDGTPYAHILHSMFPLDAHEVPPYQLTFGDTRACPRPFTITKPFYISGMSFGALGEHAVRALSRGAKKGGVPISTGEGGYPKYHLLEGPDIIFQIGTAKFGVRKDDGTLDDQKLADLCDNEHIKMVELKLSQGAKPGKGGVLPGAKVTQEIAEIRGIPVGQTVYSPSRHIECDTPANTVKFLRRVQDVSRRPVSIKMCLGRERDFRYFLDEMIRQDTFPDAIVIDGAEGGTGAAPPEFLDSVGMPLFDGLDLAHRVLSEYGIRDRTKLVASGKLLLADRMIRAFAYGADAIANARGFMFSIGCIQALECNGGRCPVGITTHDPRLQRGLDIEEKSERVAKYVGALDHDLRDLLAACGARTYHELTKDSLHNADALLQHTSSYISEKNR